MSNVSKRAGGKWKTGFGGILTDQYKAKRKKKTKMAKKSRAKNRGKK